jgi:L-ascorbate metabolism protein UlaG (beta-lactamase superfamily)
MRALLIPLTVLLTGIATGSSAATGPEPVSRQEAPARGEADIRYLHHSGWAIRTADHLLIFDYWEGEESPPRGERRLEEGWIDPASIADLKVTVFTSHSHGDHYDPVILGWEAVVPDIRYVWGWENPERQADLRFGTERRKVDLDGLEIWNIHHTGDGIPESAFLIRVDGLTIYHSGDHGTSADGPMRPDFRSNIEYLAGLEMPVDLCFLPIWGFTGWQVEHLRARQLFPMHFGGHEDRLPSTVEQLKQEGIDIPIHPALERGTLFRYRNGIIVPN